MTLNDIFVGVTQSYAVVLWLANSILCTVNGF